MAVNQLEKLQQAIISGNIPQIVMSSISNGITIRASDIHIEPEEKTVRIRNRVDGILRQIIEYPPNIHMAVISRIKIMANLKIDEQRIPQDGRIQVTTEDKQAIDLRVSTLPTVNGEKICMRIQDRTARIPTFEELGIRGNGLKYLNEGITNPNGVILNTGPTGSGKTTTLYSCLQKLNTNEVNIMTIEDPAEIQIDGLNQSQVHPDIGYNFAFGLRTALRQDPDIIMVGEIRDKETIDVAIEASLTGHLVLSTIHTNSAIDTLTRIKNMGVPVYLMTATINTIIAQRLIRKICTNCREEYKGSPSEIKDIQKTIENIHPDEKTDLDPTIFENIRLFRGKGCDQCGGTGFHGRIGVYEVLKITERIQSLVLLDTPNHQLKEEALKEGMVNLKQAGVIQVLLGNSTLTEVYHIAR